MASETGQESNKEEDGGGEPSEREKKFGRKARVKAQVSHNAAWVRPTALMGRKKKGKDKQANKEEYGATEKVLTKRGMDCIQPIS